MTRARGEDERRLTDVDAMYAERRTATFRQEAASDQHAAVAIELERLHSDSEVEFSEAQLWILLRAEKVQSHL